MLKLILPIMMILIMKNNFMKPSICITVFLFNLSIQSANTSKISYLMAGDLLSFWITNLSLWIITLIMMIKVSNMVKHMKMMILLALVLLMSFYMWSFFFFFFFFETSMVLIIITVMSWGYQPERIEATMFMVIMTSIFSLPFFLTIMNNFSHLNFWFLNFNLSFWDYCSFMFIFMVKMPVFFIHMWLPKVHVESPVHGSMILASIMLKLGCYGMIRMTSLIMKISMSFNFMILAFSLWSMTLLSLVCMIQPDLKSMIAYSSIVHMALTMASINLNKSKSIFASMIVMLGHGLCSSALFFMCNQMYKATKSRSTILNKGMASTIPTMSSLWFFLCMMNAPMPPSINMMSEILAFKIIISWSKLTIIMILAVMMFSSFYSIMIFCIPAHGQFSNLNNNSMFMTSKNLMITMMHVLPAIMIISKSNMMLIN